MRRPCNFSNSWLTNQAELPCWLLLYSFRTVIAVPRRLTIVPP
jgi:hypothetical protein